ncbi:MAG TPA: hypothetical protein VF173_00770 [Thermoanaerobaculia bacterium]|nr:hypothetical protein [Thermoanaerobaculia bacterium]
MGKELAQEVGSRTRQFERQFNVHDSGNPLNEPFESKWAEQLKSLGDPAHEKPQPGDTIEASAGLLDLGLRKPFYNDPNAKEAIRQSGTARELFLATQARLYPAMNINAGNAEVKLKGVAARWQKALEKSEGLRAYSGILSLAGGEIDRFLSEGPGVNPERLQNIARSVAENFGEIGWEGAEGLDRAAVAEVMRDCAVLLHCEDLAAQKARERARNQTRVEQPEMKEKEEKKKRGEQVLRSILDREQAQVEKSGTTSNIGLEISPLVDILVQKGWSMEQTTDLLVKMARRLDELERAHKALLAGDPQPGDEYRTFNRAFAEFKASLDRDFGMPTLSKLVEQAQAGEKKRQEDNRAEAERLKQNNLPGLALPAFQKVMSGLRDSLKNEGLL